jgi:crossover junction endodeoxyribonuclease RuvC
MRVLAIDPGYDRCGVAILEKGNTTSPQHITSLCIETSTKKQLHERIADIVGAVEQIILEYQPTQCAIEKLFFTNNQKTAMGVSEARGALMNAAYRHGLSVHEYAPNEIKVAVTGSGRADKTQVTTMVTKLVHIHDGGKRRDDEYDAIAVGITHCAVVR